LTSDAFAIVIVGPVANTKMYCEEPDNVMEQELLNLENFDDGYTMKWEVLGDGSLVNQASLLISHACFILQDGLLQPCSFN
jgi:hypothetical protein